MKMMFFFTLSTEKYSIQRKLRHTGNTVQIEDKQAGM